MEKFKKHIIQQPFVFATGLAALVHSTWSLGTLFSGKQPEAAFNFQFIGWIAPAFLIAFALDVGQIVTSAEIRAGKRGAAKFATFAVFAAATYYLQWLYIAHHMPELQLAAGVRGEWSDFAKLVRDAAIWFIPALLPLSTLLYTFSSAEHDEHVAVAATESQQQQQKPMQQQSITVEKPAPPLLESEHEPVEDESDNADEVKAFVAKCECGWNKTYDTVGKMARGLAAHKSSRACDLNVAVPQWLVEQSQEQE